ncbi:MAG: OmpA family protein [Bacteroidia bacterium]|nr:OmpA family protein [Bacteroidia bacterium]
MKFSLFFLFGLFFSACYSQQKKQYELYFDSDKALLSQSSVNTIDSLLVLNNVENISSVNIYGYCDSIGNFDYNNKLSIRRAESVKNYFNVKGVVSDSIKIKGFGKTNLKYKSEKWDKNRRVSIELCFKKKIPVKNVVVDKPVAVIKPKQETIKNEIAEFVKKSEVGDKIALKNITFYGGTPQPMPESFKTLEKLVKTLNENPTLEICIEGHICCHNNDDDNLSGRRAMAVYDYLIGFGIDKNRLSYKGFGRTRPLTEERTSAEQQMNRRVEIRIIKK